MLGPLATLGKNLIAVLTNRELISAFFGAVLGFMFAVTWDLVKDWRKQAGEEHRAMRLVRTEVMTNIELLEGAKKYLAKDTELAQENRELIAPLDPLSIRVWESVALAGTLPANRRSVFDEIGKTYVGAAILNQRIHARELYRAANKAMTRYNEHRGLINQNLMKDVERLLERFRDHLAKLTPT